MESIKRSFVTEDTNKIKKVHFKHPELVSENAENLVKEEYYALQEAKQELYKARERVRELEGVYEGKKKTFDDWSNLFTLEFDTHEVQYTVNKVLLSVKGDSVNIL